MYMYDAFKKQVYKMQANLPRKSEAYKKQTSSPAVTEALVLQDATKWFRYLFIGWSTIRFVIMYMYDDYRKQV